jgi:hypothetical protein
MDNASQGLKVSALPQLWVLHYLISEADGKHVAHCLDLDLVAVGASRQESALRLDNLVKAQIELSMATGRLMNLETKAPLNYWKQYFIGTPIELERKTLRVKIPTAVQVVPLDPAESELGILARAA